MYSRQVFLKKESRKEKKEEEKKKKPHHWKGLAALGPWHALI